MAGRGPRGKWASQADWDQHRPVITQLYIDEGKPLKEVIDILENDYDFKATAKMYKVRCSSLFNRANTDFLYICSDQSVYRDRFKQWSLYKYNSMGPSESAHRRSLVQRRGRPAQVEETRQPLPLKTNQYLVSGPSSSGYTADDACIKVESASGFPVFSKRLGQTFDNTAAYSRPRLLSSPDATTLTEVFLRLSNQFMTRNAELQVGYTWERTIPWWGELESAARLLDSQHYQEGLRLLGICFDKLVPMLQEPEPALIPAIYMCILRLPPDLKRPFISYVAKLAAIKLPKGHPLTLMWNKLRESETRDLERNAYYAITTHFDLVDNSPYKSRIDGKLIAGRTLDMFDFIRDKDHNLYSNTEEIIARSRRAMQDLEKQGRMDAVVTLRTGLGYLHWRHKRYEEARAFAIETLQWRQTLPPKERMAWPTYHPLRIMCLIELDVGTWDSYKKFSHEYIQLCYNGEGPEHHRTRTALVECQRAYRERGLDKEADELPGIFYANWSNSQVDE
ncbi:hypothetical protein PG984_007989 [Apiospora sp. TS-2023a]